MSLSLKKAFYTAVLTASALSVICPAFEKSYELEKIAKAIALVSLGMSVAAVCLAVAWLWRSTVADLRQAALATLAIPCLAVPSLSVLFWLLFNVGVNVHGVGMATMIFGGLLSLLTVAILAVGATVKHVRAVN